MSNNTDIITLWQKRGQYTYKRKSYVTVSAAGNVGCVGCCFAVLKHEEGIGMVWVCTRDNWEWFNNRGKAVKFPRCTCVNRKDGQNVRFKEVEI